MAKIISYVTHCNELTTEKTSSLLKKKLSELQRYASFPSSNLVNKLLTNKTKFNLLATNKAIVALKKSCFKHYEFGDKAINYLIKFVSFLILIILLKFRDFYVTLYSKIIYFIMIFPPHFKFLFSNERLDFCELFK